MATVTMPEDLVIPEPPVIYTGGELEGKLVTHHEISHAMACLKFEIPFDHTKVETGFFTKFTGAGYVWTTNDWEDDWKKEQVDKELMVYIAGRTAEELWLEKHPGHPSVRAESAYSDFRVVKWAMQKYPTSSLPALRVKTRQFVEAHWPQIEAGALVLEHHKKLTEAQVRRATDAKRAEREQRKARS